MNQNFQISVILPFHRDDNYLSEALKSCYESKGCTIEIILVDTRSNGESLRNPILNLPKYVKIIKGPGVPYTNALALGIKHSTFEYIALMNSDDLISNQRFEKQIQKIMETKSNVCISNIRKFAKEPGQKIPAALGNYSDSSFQIAALLFGAYGADATWLFKKDWAIKNNVFADKNDVSDWSTALRVFKNAQLCKVTEELYFYRMHKLQTSRRELTDIRILEDKLLSLNKYLDLPAIDVSAIKLVAGIDRPRIQNFFSKEYPIYPAKWFYVIENKMNPLSEDLKEILLRRKLLFCLSNYRNLRFLNICTFYRVVKDLFRLRGNARW
jgi:glycosyltransferase involved in cell wall biosynthesis